MDFMKEYEQWLASEALSAEEKAELEAIRNDAKEIESRFFDQLSFGTAGLRGTMCMGLHHMNVYVVRHATQGFANVICAETVDQIRGSRMNQSGTGQQILQFRSRLIGCTQNHKQILLTIF